MPTFKQKIAVTKVVENGGNFTKAMREAGYSEATINNPSNLSQSKGFREILEEAGLTENFVISALVEDIKLKPQNRVRELALAADVLGLGKHESTTVHAEASVTRYVDPRELFNNPEYMKALNNFEDVYKKILVQKPLGR